MSINGSSGSCHPRCDAELIPICNRLLTDLHVIRKMKQVYAYTDMRCVKCGTLHNHDYIEWWSLTRCGRAELRQTNVIEMCILKKR